MQLIVNWTKATKLIFWGVQTKLFNYVSLELIVITFLHFITLIIFTENKEVYWNWKQKLLPYLQFQMGNIVLVFSVLRYSPTKQP